MQILRFIAASFGGYVLSSLFCVSLTLLLPFTKIESVVLATMLSFIVWLCVVLYTYSGVEIKKLFIGLCSVSLVLFSINTFLTQIGV